MSSTTVVGVLSLLPFLAGLVLSVWRFRVHDPLGGLGCALGGILGMLVVILRMTAGPRR